MNKKRSGRWTNEDEVLYLEERKYRCESCDPKNEATIRWLEGSVCQGMVISVYKTHGIPPHVIYKEFEEELSQLNQAPGIVAQYMEQTA
jgi:hypothetical protein